MAGHSSIAAAERGSAAATARERGERPHAAPLGGVPLALWPAPLDARLACARACGSLCSNQIGPEGGKALAAVLPQTKLKELSLNHNQLGDEGAKQLAAALRGNETLEKLL